MGRPPRITNLTPPCYNRKTKTDCPDRHEHCHAECEKWANYLKVRDAGYEERMKRKQEIVDQIGYSIDVHYRFERYKRSHKK